MRFFRKKPVVIEAKQLTEDRIAAVSVWLDVHGVPHLINLRDNSIVIPTLEGEMTASLGDWVIKGVQGEFYPCKPDIFAATYEEVE